MLAGYMRVSKVDGSQAVELQRDALVADGVERHHLFGGSAAGWALGPLEARESNRPRSW
jgi:hypothetical protein